MIACGCPLSRVYLRSSTKNGCPTNSVLSTRRGVSAPTYIVNGTREPVTTIRNPWNVPAGTVTASGAPTLNVSTRSEEHTSELQSRLHLVCRLLLEKKKKITPASILARPSEVVHADVTESA